MFLREFGLIVHPFGISPRLDFLYKSGAFAESIAHLIYGLDNSEAIVMITGGIGTGKTMTIQSFLAHLGEQYQSALVTNTSVDAKGLLKLVLEDLGAPVEAGADKSDLLIAFKKLVIASGRAGKRILVVIDEAQNLSREALEEIRLLTNLGQGAEQPVQIVLAGQPELETILQRPDLAQLRQRIRVHYRLAPLSRKELEEYVEHRMKVAGGAAGAFTGGALDKIYELSGGVPRVVNTLCGEALLTAAVADRRKVEARDLDDSQEGMPGSSTSGTVTLSAADEARSGMETQTEKVVQGGEKLASEVLTAVNGKSAASGRAAAAEAPGGRGMPRRRAGRVVWFPVAAVVVILAALLLRPGGLASIRSRLLPAGEVPEAQTDAVSALAPPAAVQSPAVGADLRAAATAAPATQSPDSAVPAVQEPTTATVPATTNPARPESASVSTLRVQSPVRASPPAPSPANTTLRDDQGQSGNESGTGFYVHVSSFRTPEAAGDAADRFQDTGLPTAVRPQMIGGAKWYRVYLGPYDTRDTAVRLADGLRGEGRITYYKVLQLGAADDQ